MKKIFALVLALALVMAMAACTPATNNDATNGTTEANTEATNGATEGTTEATTEATTGTTVDSNSATLTLLNSIWAQFPEEGKFPVMGGDAENPNWEGPGSVTLPGAEGNALWNLNIPDEQLPNIAEAATMIHAMNTNTFAGCTLKLVEGADEATVAKAIVDAILNTRWMCGFPERVVVVSTNGCLVVAFGHEGNITNLLTAINTVDASATVLHNEVIGE